MNSKGFTLVEMMVCVAIIAIIAGIAVPNFATVIANSHIRSTADQMRDILARAAQEARKRNATVQVSAANNVVSLSVPAFGANPAIPLTQFTSKAAISNGVVSVNGSGRANADVTFSITYPGFACKGNSGPVECYNVQAFVGGAVRVCDPTKSEGDMKACL
jgi:prepilin-type N-terminal cleavage/methylation domain-containing protein